MTGINDEDLDLIAKESFKGSQHPMGWLDTFKQGFRQAEQVIQERLIKLLKDELNGLSDIEKLAYTKALKKQERVRIEGLRRGKILTELPKPALPKIVITGEGGNA